MSLTSLIHTNKDFQEIIRKVTPKAADFKSYSTEVPPFKKKSILADSNFTSYVSGLVRVSFQYMISAILARKNQDSPDKAFNPLARKGYEVIHEFFSDVPAIDELTHLFESFTEVWDSFIRGEAVSEEKFIHGAFMCSKLDTIYRLGVHATFTSPTEFVQQFIHPPMPDGESDLKLLWQIFEERFPYEQRTEIKYFPSFDEKRRRVGGASADFMIGDTLYDIKTTKKHGYNWKEAAELVTYYLLNRLEGEPYKIQKLAFYKARFGVIEYVEIGDLLRKYDMEEALNDLSKFHRRWK
ncbi:hypothetical protein QPK24_08845 [Paenibacillus polygoni]|uniref:PD-(D/E)XK nuclease superfamily protein n=1 Tax=Paenibacillus polygoni TaxID=3050112 RepID=A0ABY8X6K6_9BACL|nr:hypothetical protein [Paenibacillus polygoni]WIV20764.1 hypothetical protein QPK24_08845 [Paenibacillus polygoni]